MLCAREREIYIEKVWLVLTPHTLIHTGESNPVRVNDHVVRSGKSGVTHALSSLSLYLSISLLTHFHIHSLALLPLSPFLSLSLSISISLSLSLSLTHTHTSLRLWATRPLCRWAAPTVTSRCVHMHTRTLHTPPLTHQTNTHTLCLLPSLSHTRSRYHSFLELSHTRSLSITLFSNSHTLIHTLTHHTQLNVF